MLGSAAASRYARSQGVPHLRLRIRVGFRQLALHTAVSSFALVGMSCSHIDAVPILLDPVLIYTWYQVLVCIYIYRVFRGPSVAAWFTFYDLLKCFRWDLVYSASTVPTLTLPLQSIII